MSYGIGQVSANTIIVSYFMYLSTIHPNNPALALNSPFLLAFLLVF